MGRRKGYRGVLYQYVVRSIVPCSRRVQGEVLKLSVPRLETFSFSVLLPLSSRGKIVARQRGGLRAPSSKYSFLPLAGCFECFR